MLGHGGTGRHVIHSPATRISCARVSLLAAVRPGQPPPASRQRGASGRCRTAVFDFDEYIHRDKSALFCALRYAGVGSIYYL